MFSIDKKTTSIYLYAIHENNPLTCFNILPGAKLELNQSFFVLSCHVLMFTDKYAWVNYFTNVIIVSIKLRADPSSSEQLCSFSVHPNLFNLTGYY